MTNEEGVSNENLSIVDHEHLKKWMSCHYCYELSDDDIRRLAKALSYVKGDHAVGYWSIRECVRVIRDMRRNYIEGCGNETDEYCAKRYAEGAKLFGKLASFIENAGDPEAAFHKNRSDYDHILAHMPMYIEDMNDVSIFSECSEIKDHKWIKERLLPMALLMARVYGNAASDYGKILRRSNRARRLGGQIHSAPGENIKETLAFNCIRIFKSIANAEICGPYDMKFCGFVDLMYQCVFRQKDHGQRSFHDAIRIALQWRAEGKGGYLGVG